MILRSAGLRLFLPLCVLLVADRLAIDLEPAVSDIVFERVADE